MDAGRGPATPLGRQAAWRCIVNNHEMVQWGHYPINSPRNRAGQAYRGGCARPWVGAMNGRYGNPKTLAQKYDVEDIKRRLHSGESLDDVADVLGISPTWAGELFKFLGLEKYYGTSWSRDPNRDNAMELRRRGVSVPLIAKLLQVKRGRVCRWIMTDKREKVPWPHIRENTWEKHAAYIAKTMRELGIDLTPRSGG